MGRSAGAHLALLTAYAHGSGTEPGCDVRHPHDTGVAAVVAFYPPTDLTRLSSRDYLGGMDRFVGGTPKVVPERYHLLSPVSHVDPRDPPTFLVHGGDDQIVPPGQSELLAHRLQGAGVPHRLVELPWANHTFDTERSVKTPIGRVNARLVVPLADKRSRTCARSVPREHSPGQYRLRLMVE